MGRVAIITDSSACLPAHLIKQHRIAIVSLGLTIDGALHRDGSLSNAELFQLIEASHDGPKTASAPPGSFLDAFIRAHDEGADSVLCLTLSASFSGTYAAASDGARLAADKLAALNVHVVDTRGIGMVHGFAVLAAARAIAAGACSDEAAAVAERIGKTGRMLGTLETMRYLVKGGRVPWIVGWAASVLRLRPVLLFEDGRSRAIGRPRTWPAASDQMLRRLSSDVRDQRRLRVAVMHVDTYERAQALAAQIGESFHPAELHVTEFTSVMAAHTGPGFVGVAWYEDA